MNTWIIITLGVAGLMAVGYTVIFDPQTESIGLECSGDIGECYETTLLRVIDGDTIKTQDNTSIRFSLSSAPELDEPGGQEAKAFIEEKCPIGSTIIIDEDDMQTEGSFGRTIAKVICNGVNLNDLLVDHNHGTIDTRFCSNSEFSEESWAKEQCNK